MATDNFPACLAFTLQFEGGYVDHPQDPGGATNRGITIATLAASRGRPVTKADVKAMTVAEAGQIYRLRYWATVGGDLLPRGVDLAVFDYGANSGPARAKTAHAAARGKASDPVGQIRAVCAQRLGFVQGLRTWGTFGLGWGRRIAQCEATALRMAVREPREASIEIAKSAAAARAGAATAGQVVKSAAGGAIVAPAAPLAAGGHGWVILALLLAAAALGALAYLAHKIRLARLEHADALAVLAVLAREPTTLNTGANA